MLRILERLVCYYTVALMTPVTWSTLAPGGAPTQELGEAILNLRVEIH